MKVFTRTLPHSYPPLPPVPPPASPLPSGPRAPPFLPTHPTQRCVGRGHIGRFPCLRAPPPPPLAPSPVPCARRFLTQPVRRFVGWTPFQPPTKPRAWWLASGRTRLWARTICGPWSRTSCLRCGTGGHPLAHTCVCMPVLVCVSRGGMSGVSANRLHVVPDSL